MGNREFIKVDKNGTKVFHDYTCTRCGGQGGSEAWKFTGFTCYKCGGSGLQGKPEVYREYTPEYKAKLNEKAAKRAEAERIERNANFFTNIGVDSDGDGFIYVNSYDIKGDLKENGARYNNWLGWISANKIKDYTCYPFNINDVLYDSKENLMLDEFKCFNLLQKIKAEDKAAKDAAAGITPSEYIGNVNEKVEIVVKSARFVTSFQTQFGISFLYEFIDENDNIAIWFTGKDVDTDKVKTVKGTVKEHKLYNDVKQTVLTRCKIGE